MIRCALLSLLVVAFSASAYSKDYYVSKKGSDTHPGTRNQPFETIGKAASLMKPGDVCHIYPGIYPEEIKPSVSGLPGEPLVFEASEKDAEVVVTGADPVPAHLWEKVSGKVFRAEIAMTLGHENQVFLAGKTLVEARWPNVGDDLLEPVLSKMDEGTSPEAIVDDSLPDYNYDGAHLWIHAPLYWSDWTTRITGQTGEHTLEIENVAPYSGSSRHVATKGAEFFIFGCIDALDAENEWFYDQAQSMLYVYRDNGELPGQEYLIKRRMNAFDLTDLKHIHIRDITIMGSSIETSEQTESVLLDRLRIYYPYYSSQSNSVYGTQTNKGVMMNGKNCTIQHSEVAYSSACGIMLGGENNRVLNCYIHDTDFIGSYASCVQLRGKGNVVSHCTLTRTGRSVIDYGGMYKALVQHCDLSHSGKLTGDLGLTYGNIIEGGNSEFRYNLLHDNEAVHLNMGLYYDHGTQNIISHHNIIWGVDFSGFHLNHYAAYHLLYNNTFVANENGFRSTYGAEYDPDLLHCRMVNNLFSNKAETTADNYYWQSNISGFDDFEASAPFCFPGQVAGKGTYLHDISASREAGIGAVEYEGMTFEAGHNFEHPPVMDFTRSKPLHRNRLENSAFEHDDHLDPWRKVNGEVEVRKHQIKIHITPDTAVGRMGSYSAELPDQGSELAQTIDGLEPGTYVFTGHLRADWREAVVLGVRFPDGTEFISPHSRSRAPDWTRLHLSFDVPQGQESVEVFARRLTANGGKVYVDDFGVVMR